MYVNVCVMITKEQELKICKSYKKIYSIKKVGKQFSISSITVSNILKRNGIQPRGPFYKWMSGKENFRNGYKILPNGCWQWIRFTSKVGYGRITVNKKSYLVHQYSYVIHNGTIPKGHYIHHLCHNKSCVNPKHLQAVTAKQHFVKHGSGIAEMHRKITHCPAGHKYTKESTGYNNGTCRYCKICVRKRDSIRQKAKKTCCVNGHKYTPETVRYKADGRRVCKICCG